MNEGDFVFKPEQGPFAAILARGNFPHVAGATDFQDEQAGNAMALEEPVSDTVQFLRVGAARKDERAERNARRPGCRGEHRTTCSDNSDRREKERRECQGSKQRLHELPRGSAAAPDLRFAVSCLHPVGERLALREEYSVDACITVRNATHAMSALA